MLVNCELLLQILRAAVLVALGLSLIAFLADPAMQLSMAMFKRERCCRWCTISYYSSTVQLRLASVMGVDDMLQEGVQGLLL